MTQTKDAITERVQAFMGHSQTKAVMYGLRGEERSFFVEKMRELDTILQAAPVTYETDGLPGAEKMVSLHLFGPGNADFYIIELDKGDSEDGKHGVFPRQIQAYGLADLGEGYPELGYINVEDILRNGSELDFHFNPRSLLKLKLERYPDMVSAKDKAAYANDDPAFFTDNLDGTGKFSLFVYADDRGLLHGSVIAGTPEINKIPVFGYVKFKAIDDNSADKHMDGYTSLTVDGIAYDLHISLKRGQDTKGCDRLVATLSSENGADNLRSDPVGLEPNKVMLEQGLENNNTVCMLRRTLDIHIQEPVADPKKRREMKHA